MYIERVQIEEGFLHGLDVHLSRGLNVLIGARGTGKTSFIELVRFCLDVPGNTQEVLRRSRDHALSVLGSGQITVTLTDGHQRTVVTRSASDEQPRSAVMFPKPAIFSQTEIETVGLQAPGRLRLIDGFAKWDPGHIAAEQQAIAEFASLSIEVEKGRREIDELEKQLSVLPLVTQQIAENAAEQKNIAHYSAATAEKTKALDALSLEISTKAVAFSEGKRLLDALSQWYATVKTGTESVPQLTSSARLKIGNDVAQKVSSVQAQLQNSLSTIQSIYLEVKAAVDAETGKKVQLEDSARQLRKELDAFTEGAGLLLRKSQQLQEQNANLTALHEYYGMRKLSLDALLMKRTASLDRLDAIRTKRFETRSEVVRALNRLLGPKIRIELTRNAQIHGFSSAIADALKGSGLRFSDIASAIAENLSPRALLDAIDGFEQDLIAEVAGISTDRAARALTHLRSIDIGSLGSADIDDDANFQLLDGRDFKSFNELSTGQRCTVVLPMVLAHREKIIIVDQPEDHIDNAFIADTLIQAILGRDPASQIIFSTHNPNIPVLGNADFVVQLGSDGRRGFTLAVGSLSDEPVVTAISNVMEGGAAAFAKRSAFYAQLPNP